MEQLTHSMFSIFSQISSFPYQIDWMSNGRLLHFKKGNVHPKKFILWRCNSILPVFILAHELYSLCTWIDLYLEEKLYHLLVLHGLWIAVTLACVFCFHLTLLINHSAFPEHVYKTILLTKRVEHGFANGGKTFKNCLKIRYMACACMACFIMGTTLFSAALTAYFRRGPWFIWNLAAKPGEALRIPNKWIWLIATEQILELIQWGALSIILYVIVFHLQTVNAVVSLIIPDDFTDHDIHQTLILYQATRILNDSFNRIFQWSFIPSFLITFQIAIVSCALVFMKTMQYGNLGITGFALVLGTTSCGILYLVTLALSTVHTKTSQEYTTQVAIFAKIHKDMPLTVMDSLTDITADVLLSLEF